MANFGDILSSITLTGHQSVRRNQEDTDFEAYATDMLAVQVRVRSSDYAGGLTKGTVVYIGGATGNRPYVLKADATDESTSSKTFGILAEDIAANGDGLCAISGLVHNLALPTTTYTDGDSLWLSETAGEFVINTPPAEPAHAVFIGWVARAHPTDGHIALQIQNGYELNELHGVVISSPSDGEVLTYEVSGGVGLWKNKASGGGSLPSLTSGSVVFSNGTTLAQDNANFYWDDSNNRLGIGTTSPSASLHALQTTEQLRLGYSSTKYTTFTVDSNGYLSLTTGTGNTAISVGNNGKLTVGATTEGGLSDASKLDLTGAYGTNAAGHYGNNKLILYQTATTNHYGLGVSAALLEVQSDGDIAFFAESGVTTKTERMRISKTGGVAVSGALTVSDDAYASGWNGSTQVPTKNAVYDRLEVMKTESFVIAASDETTAITAGTNKVKFRIPYAFTVTAVRASLSTAQTSGNIFTVDINDGGTSILSTKLTIDNTESTSTTAATAAVISDSSLADDAEISIDVDQIGDSTAKGLKVVLIGYRT